MRTMVGVDLADARDAKQVGAKAANLGELIRAGFDVPVGVVLPATFDAKALPVAATEALGHLRADRFAVRSSAIAEDLAEASFAGQYETLLNVPREGVADAIRACRESASARRVAAYQEAKGLGGSTSVVAVIVQEMVDAAAAGVVFSADPITGARDRVIVSAVKGLGDRLVSGRAAADEWSVEAGMATCSAEPERAIDATTALRIADLARAAAGHFGGPQDVEWALDREGRLFVLQSRPITALPEDLRWDSPDGGSYRRNFRLGEWFFEPLTPLFDDWLVRRLEARERELVRSMAPIFPIRDRYHVLVNGWYFIDIGFLPRTPLGMLGMMLRLAAFALPRAIRNPKQAAKLLPPFMAASVRPRHDEFLQSVEPAHRRLVEDSRRRLSDAGPEQLAAIVDGLADDAGEYFVYIGLVAGYAWKAEHKLARFCRAELAGSGLTSHQELVLGCSAPAEAPPHGVVSLDWYRALPAERARPQADPEARARHGRQVARRQAAETIARAALAGRPRMGKRFEVLLAEAQEFAAIREEMISGFTLGWPVLRLAVRRLGEHLAGRGVLAGWEDVFFLTRDEVVAGTEDLAAVAAMRRSTWQRQRRLTPPLKIGPDHPVFRQRMDEAAESFRAPSSADGEKLLRGMPCSPGVARGRVRVIYGPEGFDGFKAGEVLVAPATTPGWTPLFARAAAVITDTGSVTAHASLVAREYGIPAVVSTGDATQKLRDGMLVTVDGSAGLVLGAPLAPAAFEP